MSLYFDMNTKFCYAGIEAGGCADFTKDDG